MLGPYGTYLKYNKNNYKIKQYIEYIHIIVYLLLNININ